MPVSPTASAASGWAAELELGRVAGKPGGRPGAVGRQPVTTAVHARQDRPTAVIWTATRELGAKDSG